MKTRFNREEMADALALVASVTATRTPKPILQCVRVQALPDAILLSATDLELALRHAVTQVEVDKPGEAVVLAETLARIVRECPDELLSFETKENILHIRGAGSHFQIVTSSPEDFPPVPLMEGPPDYSLEHGVLRRLVEWTAFAVARESSRYAINGILWQMERDHLMLVATDGRRLSWAQGKVTSRREGEIGQAIIPGKAAALLGKFPSHEDVVVSVKVMENQVLLSTGGINLSSALVEGHFPRYQDVIPRDNNRIVELDTAEFQGALRRAALLTNEESKAVRLSLSDGELVLSSRVPEQGEASITMPVRYRGEPLEIGFNPVFLMDVLRVVHTESVQFALKESNRPGVVSAGDDFVYVVMPVSLSSA